MVNVFEVNSSVLANDLILANAINKDERGFLSNKAFFENGFKKDKELKVNATTIRHERHKQYDAELITTAERVMTGINDIRSAGLTAPIEHIGMTLSMYERLGKMTEGEVSMSGQPAGKDDRMLFSEAGVPVPVIFKDWSLDMRHKAALNANNNSFTDVTMMSEAAFGVTYTLEKMLFNGYSTINVAGNTIYGYTNHPNRNTYTLTGSGWAVASGRDIVGDVLAMIQLLKNDKKFANTFMVYIPTQYEMALRAYTTAYETTNYLQEIKKNPEILDVKLSPMLANNNVVVVSMDRASVDLAIGMDLRNYLWNDHPFAEKHRIMGIMVPRIKTDYYNNCGVVHGSV
jgi:uncharacterized linocin/CFP29 family protein